MKPYPREQIARVKAAAKAGIRASVIAHRTGIHRNTIDAWAKRRVRREVGVDQAVVEAIWKAVLG